MKPSDRIENEGWLRELLATWKVGAALLPRFQERVWQRIESREMQPAAGPWPNWFREITAALAQPKFAISYVAVLLAAGLLVGFWQAHSANSRAAENLSARYVQMLDPYQMPRN